MFPGAFTAAAAAAVREIAEGAGGGRANGARPEAVIELWPVVVVVYEAFDADLVSRLACARVENGISKVAPLTASPLFL